ncbi:hypothetical protein MLD38_040821 [Melastoma candidum]|nr:hypothetical protein MLD38_040821 [Melastoma candidum]
MGRYASIFDNPMSRVTIWIGAAIVVAAFILLMLLFFWSISTRLRRPRVPDHAHCGGNDPPSDGRLEWVSVISYRMDTSMPSSSSSTAFGCHGCPICLGDYCTGEGVVVLPRCKHMFHKDCIKPWVPEKSLSCPVCREPVVERVADASASGTGHTLPLNFVSFGIMSNQLGLN